MLRLLTGRNRALGAALTREIAAALHAGGTRSTWWCPNS